MPQKSAIAASAESISAAAATTWATTEWSASVSRSSRSNTSRSPIDPPSCRGATSRRTSSTSNCAKRAYVIAGLPETAQRVHVLEGDHHLRLRPVVPEHPLGGVQGDAGPVLGGKPCLGPGAGGMGLQRERLVGRQHLEQVRQTASEALHYRLTDHRRPDRPRSTTSGADHRAGTAPPDGRRARVPPAEHRPRAHRAAPGSGWSIPRCTAGRFRSCVSCQRHGRPPA